MSLLYNLRAIGQKTDQTLFHSLGYTTARTTANTQLFALWNGATAAGVKFTVDLDGKPCSAAWTAGDLLYAVTGGIANVRRLDSLAIGGAGALLRSSGTAPAWTTATFPATAAAGDLLHGSATNVWSALAVGTVGKLLRSNGTIPAWSTATIPDTAVAGDLLHASATNVWGALADVAAGSVLVSGGVGLAPAWSATPTVTTLTATTLAGTLSTAAQANVTSLGSLTSLAIAAGSTTNALTVTTTGAIQQSLRYDASNRLDISVSAAGAVTLDAAGASASFTLSDNLTVNGTGLFSGTTANFVLRASDGTSTMGFFLGDPGGGFGVGGLLGTSTNHPLYFSTNSATPQVSISTAGLLTALNGLTVASGQTLTLTGATITGFTGNITGNCSGSAATVTGAAQSAITSVGTLTSLAVAGKISLSSGTAQELISDTALGSTVTATANGDVLSCIRLQPSTASAGFTGLIQYGLYLNAATAIGGGGTVASRYGIYLENVSGAVTDNYAIYTNAGSIKFGALAGTGSRAVVADANGVLSAP